MVLKQLISADPLCPVFGECGGCLYQDISYDQELQIKDDYVKEILRFDCLEEGVFQPIVPSPQEYHYRHRLDLKLLKTKAQDVFIGFTPKTRGHVVEVDACYIARKEISNFIPQLKREAKLKLPLKYRNANLVVRSGDEKKVQWGGIGKRSLEREEADYLWTEIYGRKIFYSLDTFFQANLFILEKLFDIIRSFDIWNENVRLFDLYGGVGLFSICLVDKAKEVVLIEECKPSVKIARYNQQYHSFKSFQIIEGRVENELSQVLSSEASVRNIAIIDPPRAGLSQEARDLLTKEKKFSHFIYLSCNPEALKIDMQGFLEKGWIVKNIIPFDFFPRTKHVETLVLFSREK